MILLSSIGERHEDRIPEGIFTSLDEVIKYLLEDPNICFVETNIEGSDYDDYATVIYCYDYTKDKLILKKNTMIIILRNISM